MSVESSMPSIYQTLGMTRVIHGAGTTTRYGGSLMRPETVEAMREASQMFVNIDDLNAAAGEAIANMLGAEAALVTAGAAAGLVLQSAACMTGDDPSKIASLPNTEGMKNEIVIQRAHRFPYDQTLCIPGAKLVEIGLGRRTEMAELAHAITDKTAAVFYLHSPFTSWPGLLTLPQMVEVAHAHSVPVIVDAASMLPPREHLFRHLKAGADIVNFSGGKGIRGPQSTGIIAGRKDLIRAAALNASPNQAIGRPSKTSKEEIVGLVKALELFLAEDEEAEMNRYAEVCTHIVDAVRDLPGLRAVVEQDPFNRVIPQAVIYFEPAWQGPSGDTVRDALAAGNPRIYVQQGTVQGGYFDEIAIDPINLQPGEEEIVAARLREELSR